MISKINLTLYALMSTTMMLLLTTSVPAQPSLPTCPDCSGIYSCKENVIEQCDGELFCSHQLSCQSATIKTDSVTCSDAYSCYQSTILGDATCSHMGACNLATIEGKATCSVAASCNGVIWGENASCCGVGCVMDAPPCDDEPSTSTTTAQPSLPTCPDCSGVYSCKENVIEQCDGELFCSHQLSCQSATIKTDSVTCSDAYSCYQSTILGDATCSHMGACNLATIEGKATCSVAASCNGVIWGENASCCGVGCVMDAPECVTETNSLRG